jgi:predicted transposase YbfD/YdcC
MKSRNRLESRSARVCFYPLLTHMAEWGLVKAVIEIVRYREQFDTKRKQWLSSHETAYYISTIALDAESFCRAIRNHWGIENRNHPVRDVTLIEDKSRIRVNPHIFARLRSFALNILRNNAVENVRVAIYDNCTNLQNVLDDVGVAEN